VPGEAARLGLEFLTSKIPHASPKIIMDFLRSMNKVLIRWCAHVFKCAQACLITHAKVVACSTSSPQWFGLVFQLCTMRYYCLSARVFRSCGTSSLI
jgi:hypothetical protein